VASTVIDSLVVLLGLDASNFKKGRETAEKETGETARKAKASADAITKSLTEVGRTIAGLFLGFESATGFAKWLGALNSGEAALGRTAANLGMSAHELNKWGNAVELAGGSAQDAQAAFSELTNDAEKFFVTGERSPLINTLMQYGVSIKDSNGQLRNQGEIFEELADKTAVYGRQYQNFALKQAGITQGEINYLAQSKTAREENLRTAERDNAVTDETVKKAAELQMYWRNIGLQIQAAGQMILTAITPTLEQILKVFGDVNAESDEFTTGLKLIGSAAVVIKNIFVGLGDAIGGAAAAIGAALRGDFKGAAAILNDQHARAQDRSDRMGGDLNDIWEGQSAARSANTVARSANTGGYAPPAGSKAARFNNPGNILDRQGNERRYATPDEGAAALENDLRIKMQRGLKTVDAIITAYEGGDNVRNDIPAYIADVRKRLGKNELTEADIKQLAQAIAIHESGPTARNPSAVGGGNTTTVSVGTMNVHSASADPRAVADQVPAAIQRKFSVTQADTGQS
jgi:hypothetical protein